LETGIAVISIVPVIGGAFFFCTEESESIVQTEQENIDSLNKIINESITGSALIRVLTHNNLKA